MAKRKWTPEEREAFRQEKLRWAEESRQFEEMYERSRPAGRPRSSAASDAGG